MLVSCIIISLYHVSYLKEIIFFIKFLKAGHKKIFEIVFEDFFVILKIILNYLF